MKRHKLFIPVAGTGRHGRFAGYGGSGENSARKSSMAKRDFRWSAVHNGPDGKMHMKERKRGNGEAMLDGINGLLDALDANQPPPEMRSREFCSEVAQGMAERFCVKVAAVHCASHGVWVGGVKVA